MSFEPEEEYSIGLLEGTDGTHVVFPRGSVAPDAVPGLTFGGLLRGAADTHNDQRDFGGDHVDVFEPGTTNRLGDRLIEANGRRRIVPLSHEVRFVQGSGEAVGAVI